MLIKKSVIWLSAIIIVFSVFAAIAGFLIQGGPTDYLFRSVRGEDVQIYGMGLYQYDSLLVGAGQRGVDGAILLFGIPFLIIALILYARRSIRGAFLLLGALAYFMYLYASLSFGAVMYNDLFLVYIVIFSCSLIAFIVLFSSESLKEGINRLSCMPGRRPISAFLLILACFTLGLWLESPITAMVTGNPPGLLGHYSTLLTHAIDLSILVPGFFISAFMLIFKKPRGYLISLPLLFILAFLIPNITAMTISQIVSGIEISIMEIIIYVASFTIFALFAVLIISKILREVGNSKAL